MEENERTAVTETTTTNDGDVMAAEERVPVWNLRREAAEIEERAQHYASSFYTHSQK